MIVNMEDYAEAIKCIPVFRDVDKNTELDKQEMTIGRTYIGKIQQLAANLRPELAFCTLELAKKSKDAKIIDLRSINQIVKQIKLRHNIVHYKRWKM